MAGELCFERRYSRFILSLSAAIIAVGVYIPRMGPKPSIPQS
jgi:hypothetical protein